MTKTLALIAFLSIPATPSTAPSCATAQTVQGSTVYCCSLKSGQQCCSGNLDGGKPRGCSC